MKKALVSVLTLTAFFLPMTVFAATPELSTPEEPIVIMRYQDMQSYDIRFPVSGNTGSYTLKVTGASNVTKIVATLQVEKKDNTGKYVNFGSSWTASASSRILSTSGTKTVDAGGTYRLKAVIKLYTSSTAYSTETVYS